MPYFICPNCRQRSVDHDGLEDLTNEAVGCHHCGFGFLFELKEDYYPGPNTGFVVCDQDGRVLALGRGVFELTGYRDADVIGRAVVGGGVMGASIAYHLTAAGIDDVVLYERRALASGPTGRSTALIRLHYSQ